MVERAAKSWVVRIIGNEPPTLYIHAIGQSCPKWFRDLTPNKVLSIMFTDVPSEAYIFTHYEALEAQSMATAVFKANATKKKFSKFVFSMVPVEDPEDSTPPLL